MNAYIDGNLKGAINRETVLEGLSKMGYWVEQIHTPLVPEDESLSNSIFYGNVGFIRKIVERLEYKERWIGHVPEELYSLANRNISLQPIGNIFKEKTPKFIKPTPDKNKSFDGFVYNANQLDSLYVANYFITGDELVITSDVVNFVSEWRCYICDGEILDAKHYKGNFRKFPDYSVAERAISLWKDAPISFSCDLGIDEFGLTSIVECNDVMSLGMYGLSPLNAGMMLEKRWEEIHKNKFL